MFINHYLERYLRDREKIIEREFFIGNLIVKNNGSKSFLKSFDLYFSTNGE
jgi:hypothetical protein